MRTLDVPSLRRELHRGFSATTALFALAGLAAACDSGRASDAGVGDGAPGEGGYATAETYTRPPVPSGATLIETPEFVVAPTSEALFCTVTNIILERPIETRELHSYQLRGGHHAVLFYFERHHDPAPPHPCTEDEMTDLRFVGGGEESAEQALSLPEGLGVRIPAGAQLVMQSHYLNTENRERRVQDALVIVPAAPGAIRTFADPLAINDGDFAIPPRATYGRTLDCPIDAETTILSLRGHTHDWGTRFRVELVPAGASAPTRMLYDEVAGPRLRNNPPITYFTGANALALHPGDRLRMSCDWRNTTEDTLRFPAEMCAALMYYYPSRGFLSCGTTVETRGGGDAGAGDAGDAATGNRGCTTAPTAGERCVRTCHRGNEIGVGRYCTADGNQCAGNRSAVFCTVSSTSEGSGWCTKPCSGDEGCGSGAVCRGDARGRGCVPIECVDDAPSGDAGAPAMDAASDAGTPAMDAASDAAGG